MAGGKGEFSKKIRELFQKKGEMQVKQSVPILPDAEALVLLFSW